ncbi:hypothetical protein SERLA73DRAFT_126410 [Serpula lacrymans var. lacrymans S7.3]|uniref:Uncharacterized protein n=1 Tax=Serpula lacrymans var. lacrymans (strain S7.3) TaxID=936435 RepID=F8QD22_SERL3|nr:hypothetical protein SERLA73DRAFT_126410 [Serpula lacrymans var. lacrymans S7.3]
MLCQKHLFSVRIIYRVIDLGTIRTHLEADVAEDGLFHIVLLLSTALWDENRTTH